MTRPFSKPSACSPVHADHEERREDKKTITRNNEIGTYQHINVIDSSQVHLFLNFFGSSVFYTTVNKRFAPNGHMVQNPPCWRTENVTPLKTNPFQPLKLEFSFVVVVCGYIAWQILYNVTVCCKRPILCYGNFGEHALGFKSNIKCFPCICWEKYLVQLYKFM